MSDDATYRRRGNIFLIVVAVAILGPLVWLGVSLADTKPMCLHNYSGGIGPWPSGWTPPTPGPCIPDPTPKSDSN